MTYRYRTVDQQIEALERLQLGLTRVLVAVAVVALAFTATNVTAFASDHHISPWIAWLLDPMVAVALGAVLIVDGRLMEHGVTPSGWACGLRWFAGGGTWLMNCWSSLWPAGSGFGVPRHVDPAGLVLHSVPPVLLIVLAEAITHYRRAILARIAYLRDQVNTDTPVVDDTGVHRPAPPPSTSAAPPVPAPAKQLALYRERLVICGGRQVYPLTVPPHSTDAHGEPPEAPRLDAEDALRVIRACWERGETIAVAARKSTRSTSYVHKVYKHLTDTTPASDNGAPCDRAADEVAVA